MPHSAAVHLAAAKAEGGKIELPADSCKVGTAMGHHLVNNMNNMKVKCSNKHYVQRKRTLLTGRHYPCKYSFLQC